MSTNTECLVCNRPLIPADDAIWASEDGWLTHLQCVDALASIVLRTHMNARSAYTKTITENFLANARLQLVRSGDVYYV